MSRTRTSSGAVDEQRLAVFSKPGFKADTYIKQFAKEKCSAADDPVSVLKLERDALAKDHEKLAQGLKKNVFRNYTAFINTAKSVATLESDMTRLRTQLLEQSDIVQAVSGVVLSERAATNVEDESMDASEDPSVVAILSQITGHSRFLPHHRSRILRCEYEAVEIDADSHAPKRTVRLILFDDQLLVATQVVAKRKLKLRHQRTESAEDLMSNASGEKHKSLAGLRRRLASRVDGGMRRLIADSSDDDIASNRSPNKTDNPDYEWRADHSMSVRDLTIQDIKPVINADYAFETVTPHRRAYNLSCLEDKQTMLAAIEKGRQRARTTEQQRVEAEERAAEQRKRDYRHAQSLRKQKEAGEVAQAILSTEWIMDMPDEVDVFIAYRDFTSALTLILRASAFLDEQSSSTVKSQLLSAIEERSAALAEAVQHELRKPMVSSHALKAGVQVLRELGHVPRARLLYLGAAGQRLRVQLRALKLDNSAQAYIVSLSTTFSTAIKAIVKEFNVFFPEPEGHSAFVVWSLGELERFTEVFGWQVFHRNHFAIVSECVRLATQHIQQLTTEGIDLVFVFQRVILADLRSACELEFNALLVNAENDISSETWQSTAVAPGAPQLCECTIKFIDALVKFKRDAVDCNILELLCFVSDLCIHAIRQFTDLLLRRVALQPKFRSIIDENALRVVSVVGPNLQQSFTKRIGIAGGDWSEALEELVVKIKKK